MPRKKITKYFVCLATISGLLFFFAPAFAFEYVLSTDRQAYPDPLPSKPAKGVAHTDPIFHTTITRITDTSSDCASCNYIKLRYAKWSPENANGTMALLMSRRDFWVIWDVDPASPTKWTLKRKMGWLLGHPTNGSQHEPRWDSVDPNIIWYVSGMQFKKYDYLTNTHTVVRDFSSDFPAGEMILTDDEGDSDSQSRYWAWFLVQGGTKYLVFTYDRVTNTIIGILDHDTFLARHGLANNLTISDDGSKVAILSDYGTWNTSVYSLDFSSGNSLNCWANHGDTGKDKNGNMVYFGMDLIAGTENWGVQPFSGSGGYRLWRRGIPGYWTESGTGWSYAHVSGNHTVAKPGWGLFSTYAAQTSYPCRTNGNKFDCELISLIELNNRGDDGLSAKVWQIARTYNMWGYTHAVMNNAGTRIYFETQWLNGNFSSQPAESATYPNDTYIIDLPSTWYQDLSGGSPTDTTPPSPPTGVVVN